MSLRMPWFALLAISTLACEDKPGKKPPVDFFSPSDASPAPPTSDRMEDPVDNAANCPTQEPTQGSDCPEAGLVCKFGSDPDCRSRWVCDSQNAWTLEFAMRDCGASCPMAEPKPGDPCDVERTQCTYGDAAQCRSLWLCWEEKWARIIGKRDCDADVFCPEVAPETGDECAIDEATPAGGLCVYSGGIRCGCACGWGPPDEQWKKPEAQWFCSVVSAQLDPQYLRACPLIPPNEGDACKGDNTCGYVNPTECEARGEGSSLVRCVGDEWTYSEN